MLLEKGHNFKWVGRWGDNSECCWGRGVSSSGLTGRYARKQSIRDD